jgi:hypothetical protein
MEATTKRTGQDREHAVPRATRRREMVEGLLLLAALIVLAILAKLPAA